MPIHNLSTSSSSVVLSLRSLTAEVFEMGMEEHDELNPETRRRRLPRRSMNDLNAAAEDEDTARKLEAAVVEWTSRISDATRREEARGVIGAGPLDEIEFWRERDVALTSLHEQLVAPKIRDAVAVVAVASPAVMPDFEEHASKLARMRAEARDNRKFLATLERHFRNITHWRDAGSGDASANASGNVSETVPRGSLSTAIDTVAPMMNALRMVWIISRHYGDDTRMGGLMGRVADEIGRVASEVADAKNPATGVFAVDAATALSRVRDAKRLLNTWRDSYMAMREKIEKSGRDNRWEFDRKRLFHKTEYVASVCGDLEQMLDAVHGFHRFLGGKLKTVTGDPEAIDEVINRVTDMARAARSVEFDIFDPKRFADAHDDWRFSRLVVRAGGAGSFKFGDDDFEIQKRAFRVAAKEGAYVLWDQRLVHGTAPNDSNKTRMAQFVKGFRKSKVSEQRFARRSERVRLEIHKAGAETEAAVSELGRKLFGLE